MKLKEFFKEHDKDFLYDKYVRIVFGCKEYDDITINTMSNEVIKEYHNDYFLFDICTEKELNILKKIRDGKLTKKDKDKFFWELYQLQDKLIIDKNNNVFEELEDAVEDALKIEIGIQEKNIKDLDVFVVGYVKTNASSFVMVIKSILSDLYKIPDNAIEECLYSSSFVHYYCGVRDRWMKSFNEYKEELFYRDYEGLLQDIDQGRKEYGIAGSLPFSSELFSDMFYYGMPLNNSITKKLYDEILKSKHRDFLFDVIEMRRLFNKDDYFINLSGAVDNKMRSLIEDGVKEIPCAVMNSFTPNQYYKEKEVEVSIDIKFTHVPQNDAHLPKRGAEQFYKLYFALLEYTNTKYKVNQNIDKIYKQKSINAEELVSINDYLFDNKHIIDEFINDNPYKFNKEELDIICEFKTAVKSNKFVIVGYERNYTKVLSLDEGKIYMIKGVIGNLDKILKDSELPIFITTTLLMFKGNIIYNSFLSNSSIKFGNDVKRVIVEDIEKGMEYYHL